MFKKIRLYNKLLVALLLATSSICSLFTASLANAATPYDDAVQLTNSATLVSPDGLHAEDVSNSWFSEMDASTSPDCDIAVAEIQALDFTGGGMLGVSTFTYPPSDFNGTEQGVYVYWQKEGGQLGFRADGSRHRLMGYNGANITTGSTGADGPGRGSALLYINNAGVVRSHCSGAFNLSENTVSASTSIGEKIFYTNWPVNYPTGYEGDVIPSYYQGGVVRGNVQCANSNNIISAVRINTQSGVDGNAVITNDGNGGKNYRFYLAEESPYSLVVTCDGDPFFGPTVDSDFYNIYSWACATTGGINACAAS